MGSSPKRVDYAPGEIFSAELQLHLHRRRRQLGQPLGIFFLRGLERLLARRKNECDTLGDDGGTRCISPGGGVRGDGKWLRLAVYSSGPSIVPVSMCLPTIPAL